MSETNSEENVLFKRKEFGDYLKSLREKHGLSIEGISQETKISPHFLRALEAGTFEQLPGKVFGRGFIKNISRLVNVDAGEIVNLYDACWTDGGAAAAIVPRASAQSVERETPQQTQKKAENAAKRQEVLSPLISKLSQNQIVMGFAVVVGLVILFVGYQRLTKSHVTSPVAIKPKAEVNRVAEQPIVPAPVVQETNMEAPAEVPAVAEAPVKTVVETPDQVAASQGMETHKIQPNGFEQVVEINVREPVTVKARIDGRHQEFWDLRKDVTKVTFQESAELLISDGSAVDITFNNKSLGTLGTKGRMRRITFQAKAPTDLP